MITCKGTNAHNANLFMFLWETTALKKSAVVMKSEAKPSLGKHLSTVAFSKDVLFVDVMLWDLAFFSFFATAEGT